MSATWPYLVDGKIEAVYYSLREMEFGLHTLGLVRTALELGGICVEAAIRDVAIPALSQPSQIKFAGDDHWET